MTGSQRRVERVGALRGRLIASILVASLMPFFAAWWIANAYVADQARSNAEVRLTVLGPLGVPRGHGLLATTRSRALELAGCQKLQRAARRGDRPALVRLLGRARRCISRRDGGAARRSLPPGWGSDQRVLPQFASASRRQDDAWRRFRSQHPSGRPFSTGCVEDGARGHG